MRTGTRTLVAMAALTSLAAATQAATTFDANIVNPPGVYFGSGNPNGGFTVVNDNGIEVALRAKYRQNANPIHSSSNVYNVVPGAQTAATSGGAANPARAAWNYEFSINLNPDNDGSYLTLADITATLTISDSNGNTTSLNAITGYPDNAGWGPAGENFAIPNLATDWGTQQSGNPVFAEFAIPYNMNASNITYSFKLDVVRNSDSFLLATNNIDVHVVPLPASAWGGLALLGLMGGTTAIKRARAVKA